MRLARTAPMPVTSRRRSGSASIDRNLFTEGAHQLLGVDWSNAAYHARAEVFLDAVERRRLRGLQKLRLKLLAVGAIVDPLADAVIHSPAEMTAACPITVTNSRCPRALIRRTQAGFIVVKSHALDRARQNFLVVG